MATSSFFYGGGPGPDQTTVNELIVELNEKVAAAEAAKVAAETALGLAQSAAANAQAAESSTSNLLVQAQAALTAAQQAQDDAEAALVQVQAALVETAADVASADAARVAAQAAQALAETAQANAETAQGLAEAAQAAAQASASAASTSASNASTSASNASSSASAASGSASAASASASAAATSETNALASENAAASSASAAAGSASDASGSASAAASSASAASASASAAATSEANTVDFKNNAQAAATTLAPGSAATATYNPSNLTFTFGIPEGIQGATGAVGPGVAAGGTTGQFLQKNSSTDYDTVWGDALPKSGGTLTGNLNFDGNGRKITGDFSNATVANRLAIQSNVTDGNTVVPVLPNGTATSALLEVYNSSDINNSGYLQTRITGDVAQFNAAARGTGSFVPMNWVVGGSERMRLTTDGNLGVGTNSPSEKLTVSGNASVSGNLTFTGTGNRITGDFTNATLSDRVSLQTSTTNGNTIVSFLPNGTSVISALRAYNNSSPTNSAFLNAGSNSGEVFLQSSFAGSGTALPLTFSTNAAERMRIDTSGNVGIGTASPFVKLDVSGNSSFGLRNTTAIPLTGAEHYFGSSPSDPTRNNVVLNFSNDGVASARIRFYKSKGSSASPTGVDSGNPTGIIQFYGYDGTNYINSASIQSGIDGTPGTNDMPGNLVFATTADGAASVTERMRIDSSGNLMVGTTSNGGLSGNIVCPAIYNRTSAVAANMGIDAGFGMFRSTSSLKYKTDVQDATHGLAEVMQLRPVTYRGKNDGNQVFGGLLAEEVHEAGLTEFVQYAEDGTPDALSYGNMVSLAFKAIQELKAELDTVKAELATLKG
jgi:hypothetical protein